MQAKSTLRFLTVLALLLPLSPLQAQSLGGALRGRAPAEPSPVIITNRIIENCTEGTEAALCTLPGSPGELIHKTVTLQIPDFQPENLLSHVYVMVDVGEGGAGSGSAAVDEFGLVSKQHAVVANPQGTGTFEEERQFYLIATNITTLETRVTLDLHEVRLWPFLGSLQQAIQDGLRQAGAGNRPGPRSGPLVQGDIRVMQADIRLSIQGEHLSVDEVLDALYLETGCVVDHTPTTMVVVACRQ